MSEDPKDRKPKAPLTAEPTDREAILARRQRFVAIALAGIASSTGCESGPTGPMACLSVARDGDTDTGGEETGPMACLGIAGDAGDEDADMDAANDGSDDGAADDGANDDAGEDGANDVGPMPCLSVSPPDAGDDDDADV